MATPMTPDQFLAALRAEGLTVREVGSWRTWNRNHKGAWGPINGSILHHTAGREAGSTEFCRVGMADLPGPLCHVVIHKDGTVDLISAGRSNHAGGGDPDVLQAVIDERYNDAPPRPRYGNANGVDGNAHFYGAECVNMGDGKDPWPTVQVDAMVRFCAAVSRHYDWTEKSGIAHREWSSDKPDPAGPGMPSMPTMRAKIAERLAHPASWNPTTAPDPTTGTPMSDPNLSVLLRTEDTVLVKDQPKQIYWTGENADTGNEHGESGKTVLDGGRYTATLNLRLTGLGENEVVELAPVEEDGNGNFVGAGAPHEIEGRGNPALPVQVNVTVTGRVYGRLSFQLTSRTTSWVTVTDAQLVMLSWPTA